MLVVVEGIDGSGKGTLVEKLSVLINGLSRGTAATISFPRYTETLYGKIVGRYLNGGFGDSAQHPLMHGTLFALDRFEARDYLLRLMSKFDIVICDRYVPSNLCYSAMMAPPEERTAVIEHFLDLEYGVFQMPKPDLIFVLDLPVKNAVQNIAKKGQREYTDRAADIFEADEKYLKEVKSFYDKGLKESHPSVSIETIECVRNGDLLPIDEIAQQVFSVLLSYKPQMKG